MDLFTPEFKRLKGKNPPPCLNDVIDLLDCVKPKSSNSTDIVQKLSIKSPCKQILGIKPCTDWNVFQFNQYPGFMVIQNPFIDGFQRYWVSRCLQDFPADKRNVTNLSALGDLNSFDLWHKFEQVKRPRLEKDDPLRKLRWTTLGYHYDWNTKEYYEDRKAEFPMDIKCLTQYFAQCLDMGSFIAEAAIVNYYHLDSTLAGHTDHSELDHAAPLFSISFGQTGVFMLGGLSKADKPMSIFLRSGDVCVMSGPCRLAYHAVPKILPPSSGHHILSCFHFQELVNEEASSFNDTKETVTESSENVCCKPERTNGGDRNDFVSTALSGQVGKDKLPEQAKLQAELDVSRNINSPHSHQVDSSYIDTLNTDIEESLQKMDWSPFSAYLQTSRINLNVRQVFPCDQSSFHLKSSKSKDKS